MIIKKTERKRRKHRGEITITSNHIVKRQALTRTKPQRQQVTQAAKQTRVKMPKKRQQKQKILFYR